MKIDKVARWATGFLALFIFVFGAIHVPPEWERLIIMVGVVWAVMAGHCFILFYHLRYRWWNNSVGRHMMSFMAGLTAILDLSLIAQMWPDMPGRQELRILVWILIPFLFTWRLVLLLTVKQYGPDGNIRQYSTQGHVRH